MNDLDLLRNLNLLLHVTLTHFHVVKFCLFSLAPLINIIQSSLISGFVFLEKQTVAVQIYKFTLTLHHPRQSFLRLNNLSLFFFFTVHSIIILVLI